MKTTPFWTDDFPRPPDLPAAGELPAQVDVAIIGGGYTGDLLPHIGRIDGIHYALGYGGHGLSLATYLGNGVGLLLSGQKSRSLFAEIPHDTRWFYRGRPWFIPFAAQYYRFLDWIS